MDNSKSVYSDYEDDEELVLPEDTYHSYNDILVNYDTLKINNVTQNVMTKFEKAKVLGIRSQQLAKGAKPLIDVDGMTSVDWDLKNDFGIPIASGLYIIHIRASLWDATENRFVEKDKVIKWFGALRPIDLDTF